MLALDIEAARVVDLERLRAWERQIHPIRDRLREGATAEREHPCPFDAALSNESDVGRPAADVDEQRARLADLVVAQHARHGIRLGDDLEQLEVELGRYALERPEMDQWRERVEDPDLDVATLEADRVRQGVAVDRGRRHRRVDEADVDVRQARSPK